MILNSNALKKFDKKMILDFKFNLDREYRVKGVLGMYFYVGNEMLHKLDEDFELSMRKTIQDFNSINNIADRKNGKYTPKRKLVDFLSQTERDFFIKEIYSCGLNCKYPAFLKIYDNYFFLNELNFIDYAKEKESDLVWEKYDEIDCFMIENIYGLDEMSKKGYKKANKEYKIIREK